MEITDVYQDNVVSHQTNSSLGWGDSGSTTNGFTVYKGTNASINENGETFVAWTWK